MLDGRAIMADLSFATNGGKIPTILGSNALMTVSLQAMLGVVQHEKSIAERRHPHA